MADSEMLHKRVSTVTQHATFTSKYATSHATAAQPVSLKALALRVLKRNNLRNNSATKQKDACNKHSLCATTDELTQQIDPGWPLYEPVRCADCQHFIPDPIGGGGIGDCNQNIKQRKPYWPNAERMCGKLEAKQ